MILLCFTLYFFVYQNFLFLQCNYLYINEYQQQSMKKSNSPTTLIMQSYQQKLSIARSLRYTKLQQSIPAYKKCLFLNQTADILIQLAVVYQQMKDTSTALSLYRRAQQLDSKCSSKIKQLTLVNGFNLILSGSSKPLLLDSQFRVFQQSYQKFRSYVLSTVKEGQIIQSLCYLEMSSLINALEQIQKNRGINETLLLCFIHFSLGNKVQAYQLFWRAYSLDKENIHVNDVHKIIQPQIQTLYRETQLSLIEGKLEKCIMNIKKGLEMDAYSTDFLILKAYIHRSKGEHQLALNDLEMAYANIKDDIDKVNVSNQMTLVYNEIGKKHFEQDRIQHALELFKKAIKVNPTDWSSRVNLGDCHRALGEYSAAISDYLVALQKNSSNQIQQRIGSTLNSRGIVYFNSGQYQEALQDFNASIKHFPSSKFYFNRGRAYLQISKFGEALNDFQTVLQLEPTHAEALSYIIQHRKK